jgi:hypothetical protein
MATPELAAGSLGRSRQREIPAAGSLSPVGSGQVVEFDRRRSPAVAGDSPRSARRRGFVYDGARAGRALRAGLSQRAAACRPLPMEDVCLYMKAIDNSQLTIPADPRDRGAWMRLVGLGFLALILIVASHAPHTLLRQSGYRIEKLHQQHQAMAEINEQLKVRHAMMSDLRRVVELASEQGLADTPLERFAWQDRTIEPAADDGKLAQSQFARQP